MRRFILRCGHHPEKGLVMATRFCRWSIAMWLGYGRPVWWIPRFIGSGSAGLGFGFGWLLLCFRVQVNTIKK